MTSIWTQPRTWSVGELTTAALMNQHLRDNLDFLKTPPQNYADIGATVTLSSTSYADILTLPATITPSVANATMLATFCGYGAMSAAILGSLLTLDVTEDGNSLSGSGVQILQFHSIGAGGQVNLSFALYAPLRAASAHTYKLRGKISAGTASIFGSAIGALGRFAVREI